ncbi:MAG: M1 family metallopeptidase [Lutibacter sp.]|uniref:M1 family metallopeptidase n=1 Tax=Lutibacter sp. TaxID=1925666 RepID=UPI0017B7D664|nr:M1 family metallopeptidase [Lutibacter sp.]MBT8316348.1 M1 family metallopeptidase [Lutibacter sp.]NNJ57208.1 M1 family metallopeptidase [Lutibacter sp.]
MKKLLILFLIFTSIIVKAQNNIYYWQQHVDYQMDVDFDVNNYQYKGTQKLVYTNNSPDILHQVFYHLYYNAFQPNSEMDARLQAIVDPDRRMVNNVGTNGNLKYESRIAKLKPNEIGYLNVLSLTQNGEEIKYTTEGTVLEVQLNKPIQPGEKATFEMTFEGQLPVHIRRAGRNNEDGVALSMAQWYPKMAEYDFEGWHAHPYIAREFHGVWGNFDVTLHIDRNYTVGGTGILQNPQEVGHGYEDKTKQLEVKKGKKLTWNFVAENVHDFTWAADPNYAHDTLITKGGTVLHFLYKNIPEYAKAWKEVQPLTEKALNYYNENIGQYPWKQYSVIQAGDGGMEYAMCTFIAGGKSINEIAGTVFHEFAHTWFHNILASNESKHSWMDEGFTSYISSLASNKILRNGNDKPSSRSYRGYFYLVNNGLDESLTTHADRFNTNRAFGTGSYTKGSMFLTQLNYIMGEENVKEMLKKYFNDFKFKHPTPNDAKRVAEKVSGLQLDWFLNEWIETTHTIDYAIAKVDNKSITLARIGQMPMPIDLTITYVDGSTEDFNIPLRMMRGNKPTSATILKDWTWAHPKYTFSTSKEIKSVQIDPFEMMADIDKTNNRFEKE